MIKAVIFDMDGLLIDSEPLWQRAEKEIFKSLGIELTQKDVHAMMGVRTKEVVEHLYHEHPWDGPSQQEIVDKIINKVTELIKAEGKLLPGVHKVLQICKDANLPVAIASSSTNKLIDTVVDTLRIREHFAHIYSAEFEAYGKPHPGVFIKTAELLNTLPINCLVFEDAPSGVLAAKAAKMKCIAVPEEHAKNHPFIQTADKVIESLEQFDETMLAHM